MEAIFSEFVLELLGLIPPVASVAGIIAALIALGKVAGIVKDGYSGYFNLGLNAVFWVGLFFARAFGAEAQVMVVLAALNEIAPIIVAAIGAMAGAKATHEVAKRSGFSIKAKR